MIRKRWGRGLAAGVAAMSLAALGVAGTATAATAAPAATHARVAAPAATQPITVTFALFAPDDRVTFTVNGTVVGTGRTNANGDVTFTYTPAGLAPGYYRLVATTYSGITSSVGFGVR